MAIRAADAGNYPWMKKAAGTYAATANGTPPGGKQGGCVLLIKPGGGEAAGDGLAWGCKASMFVITFFNLLSRLLPTFFQRQCAMGKKEGR